MKTFRLLHVVLNLDPCADFIVSVAAARRSILVRGGGAT